MKTSKKAQGHVEIILATVLFIGFLVFVFVFLNSSLKTTKEIPTQKIQNAILEQTQEEIGKLSIVLGSSENACIKINEINRIYGNKYTFVIDPTNSRRYTLYYGQSFTPNRLPSGCGANSDFTPGAYLEEKIIFEEKIELLVAAYQAKYPQLKQDLGVDNFAFEFKELDADDPITRFSVRGKIPDNVDVISKDFPVRIINKNAETSNLILNIKAWR